MTGSVSGECPCPENFLDVGFEEFLEVATALTLALNRKCLNNAQFIIIDDCLLAWTDQQSSDFTDDWAMRYLQSKIMAKYVLRADCTVHRHIKMKTARVNEVLMEIMNACLKYATFTSNFV